MASHRTRTFGAEPNCYLLQPNQFLSRIHARKHDVSVSPVHQRTERETCLQFASCNAGSTHSSHAERLDDIRDAEDITLQKPARTQARSMPESRRNGEKPASGTSDIPFETVAEEVFRRYRRHWKPRARAVNAGFCRNLTLPWFRGRPIADIARQDVLRWFASLHATPAAADRPVIPKQAEVCGYRPGGSDPCTGIKRHRRRGRERFLTTDGIGRLSRVPDRYCESHPPGTSIVRLVLLTGCRKSQIPTPG